MTTPLLGLYREIPLTRGLVALVDIEDYDLLVQYKWLGTPHGSTAYAKRTAYVTVDGRKKPYDEHMHRVVMKLPNGNGLFVDHINGDGLDNRKSNLRVCTHSQNVMNQKRRNDNTSGYKGVSWNSGAWVATISINRKQTCIGRFPTPAEAYEAYCKAAKEHHGEFARMA